MKKLVVLALCVLTITAFSCTPQSVTEDDQQQLEVFGTKQKDAISSGSNVGQEEDDNSED